MRREQQLIGLVILLSFLLAGETVCLFSLYSRRLSRHRLPPTGNIAPLPEHATLLPPAWKERTAFANKDNAEAWEPFYEMERIQHQMNRLFKDSFDRAARNQSLDSAGRKSFFEPDMDLKETPDSYIVRLDVPGLPKEDIQVELKGDFLTISGERKKPHLIDQENTAYPYSIKIKKRESEFN